MTGSQARIRSALFLPASNPRAIAKARTLAASLIILDLEDSVPDADKAAAREAAVSAVAEPDFPVAAIRLNAADSPWYDADVAAVARSRAAFAILPKVEDAGTAAALAAATGKPVLAMIESPRGVFAARDIAAAQGAAGLIAGTNDLAESMRLPRAATRSGNLLALQTIVLAARAAGGIALDGVFNGLDDPDGLAAECDHGRMLGFDGKTLIHPNQIAVANRAFGPTDDEIEDARALVASAGAGAERFRGRMIEAMHVRAAELLLAEAGRLPG
jgi:(3S)-malyl-CoA thioesterase